MSVQRDAERAIEAARAAQRANKVVMILFVIMVISLGLAVAACDNRQCTDGAQRIETTNDVFLCIDGRWKRQDNPYEPPIKA